MRKISDITLEELKSRTDIVSVIGDYVRLEKNGNNYKGLCPFHNEKTPSFTVTPSQNFFYCFGCKKHGDAIQFIREIEKCSYVESIERLSKKFGVTLTFEGEEDPKEIEAAKNRDALYELYDRLGNTFHYLLINDKRGAYALNYISRRKMSKETIENFKLGYIPSGKTWLYDFLIKKSYSPNFLANSGLFSKRYPKVSIFSNRLIFPIKDHRSRIVAFGGRLLSGDGPKYINSPETAIYKKHEVLYAMDMALPAVKQKNEIIICEGYMDALAYHESGITNAAAQLGTAFTQDQVALIKRFAKKVIIGLDSDAAGTNAAEKSIVIAENAGLDVSVLVLKNAKDACEILEKSGKESLKKNVISTITSDEFIISNAMKLNNGGLSIQASFAYLFPFAMEASSEIRRDTLLNEAAKRFGIDVSAVKNDFDRFKNGNYSKPIPKKEKQTARFVPNADASFVAAIIINRSLYKKVRSEIQTYDFNSTILKDAVITLEECFRNDEFSFEEITEHLADEGFKAFVRELASKGIYSDETKSEIYSRFIEDGVLRLKERSLEKQKKRIIEKIRFYNSDQDSEEFSIQDLLEEKMNLDNELAKIKEERRE